MKNEQTVKRLKSLAWRGGAVVAVSALTFLLSPETLDALREAGLVIPAFAVAVGSLILAEITKYLNRKAE